MSVAPSAQKLPLRTVIGQYLSDHGKSLEAIYKDLWKGCEKRKDDSKNLIAFVENLYKISNGNFRAVLPSRANLSVFPGIRYDIDHHIGNPIDTVTARKIEAAGEALETIVTGIEKRQYLLPSTRIDPPATDAERTVEMVLAFFRKHAATITAVTNALNQYRSVPQARSAVKALEELSSNVEKIKWAVGIGTEIPIDDQKTVRESILNTKNIFIEAALAARSLNALPPGRDYAKMLDRAGEEFGRDLEDKWNAHIVRYPDALPDACSDIHARGGPGRQP